LQLTIRSGADAGKTVAVEGSEFTIGRHADCDLVLSDLKVSRRHAAIRVLPDGRATLVDLGSSNGTYVNGQRVQSILLTGSEYVQMGDTVIVPTVSVEVPGGDGATAVRARPEQPREDIPSDVYRRQTSPMLPAQPGGPPPPPPAAPRVPWWIIVAAVVAVLVLAAIVVAVTVLRPQPRAGAAAGDEAERVYVEAA
jgi:predicted component of type VI protein secretion system